LKSRNTLRVQIPPPYKKDRFNRHVAGSFLVLLRREIARSFGLLSAFSANQADGEFFGWGADTNGNAGNGSTGAVFLSVAGSTESGTTIIRNTASTCDDDVSGTFSRPDFLS
jgi:hypothetical protein